MPRDNSPIAGKLPRGRQTLEEWPTTRRLSGRFIGTGFIPALKKLYGVIAVAASGDACKSASELDNNSTPDGVVKMILHGLPQFQTNRLRLETPVSEEAESLAEIINASVNELSPWVGFVNGLTNATAVQAAIKHAQTRIAEGTYMQWRIWTRHDRTLIGSVDVHDIHADVPKAELGFWLSTASTGRGYAQEAVCRVLTYLLAERGFARVELRCDTRNARAIGVAERIGLPREGIARNAERDPHGNLADHAVFAITAISAQN